MLCCESLLCLTYHLSLYDGICLTTLYITSSRLFILSVLFTFIFLLKYGSSFRSSSSHIIFAGLFFSPLLSRSLGCSGTVFCTVFQVPVLFFPFILNVHVDVVELFKYIQCLALVFISFFEVTFEENYFFYQFDF